MAGLNRRLPVTGDETIVVKGLSNKISYSVRVRAHNGIDWGDDSPASKPMKLADYKPPACAPVLDRVLSDSVRVFCALLSNCTDAIIFFKNLGTGRDLMIDEQRATFYLNLNNGGSRHQRADCYKGVVVPGLSPDSEAEVYYKQCSDFAGLTRSPPVPGCKFRRGSPTPITADANAAEARRGASQASGGRRRRRRSAARVAARKKGEEKRVRSGRLRRRH